MCAGKKKIEKEHGRGMQPSQKRTLERYLVQRLPGLAALISSIFFQMASPSAAMVIDAPAPIVVSEK